MKETAVKTVDQYIAQFPQATQKRLKAIRKVVKGVAPQAEESISYGMPAYKHNKKPMIYFAGYAGHVGLYATPAGHAAFDKELANYKQGKGSVQFPLNEPLPLPLIEAMAKFKYEELGGDRSSFTDGLSAPAKRALDNAGINTAKQLAQKTKKDILALHGIGRTAIPVLEKALAKEKLKFKD